MNRRLQVLAICLLLFLCYLGLRGSNRHSQNINSIAILKEKNRDVQLRRFKTLSWDDVEKGQHFQYYDSILTMKDSQADVTFNDGTNLEIGSDSLVVLEPPVQEGDVLKINVRQGTATLLLKRGEKIEAKDRVIQAKDDITIKLASDAKSTEDTIIVLKNEGTESTPVVIGTIKNRNPSSTNPTLLRAPIIKLKHQTFKINGHYESDPPQSRLEKLFSVLIPTAQANEDRNSARLEWEALPEASSFEIEFSSDQYFKNIIMMKTTEKNFTELEIDKPGTFYWRVRGLDRDGNPGPYSEMASFVVTEDLKRTVAQTPLEEPQPQPQPQPQLTESATPTPAPELSKPEAIETPVVVENPTQNIVEHNSEWVDKPKNRIGLELRGLGTFGSMSDANGTFPSRSMLTGGAAMTLGVRLGHFTLNSYGEYFLSNQTTQLNSVQNQNASGTGYLIGGELKYTKKRYSVAGSYLFLGQYQLKQQTTLSLTSTYDQPSGFSLTLGWALTHHLSFLVTGKYVTYSDWNLSGNISNDKISQISYGVGISYELF